MTTFYVVRHGETLLNRLGRAQGWCDSPLTSSGRSVAIELAKALSDTCFDAAYCSDSLRAEQTAKIVLAETNQTNLGLKTDARLREWCLGDMEAEQNSKFTETVAQWLGGISSFRDLNSRLPEVAEAIYEHDTTGMAEPFSQIENRLNQALLNIVTDQQSDGEANMLIVTHAFVIKTLFHMYSPKKLEEIQKVSNSSVFKLHHSLEGFSFE